jgi:hypothetical protein
VTGKCKMKNKHEIGGFETPRRARATQPPSTL